MTRHIWLVVICTLVTTSPLPAQEPYYPPIQGYVPEPAYDSQRNNREFHFNPSNTFNSMGNPFRNMFGSSNRVYDDYPQGGYPIPPMNPYDYGATTSPSPQAPRGDRSDTPVPRYDSYPDAATQRPAYEEYANPYAQPPAYDGYPDPAASQPGYENYANPYAQPPAYDGYPDPATSQPGYEGYANPYAQPPVYDGYPDPAASQPGYEGYANPYLQQPGYDSYQGSNPAQPPVTDAYPPADEHGGTQPLNRPLYGIPADPSYGEGYRFRPRELAPSPPMPKDQQQAPAYERDDTSGTMPGTSQYDTLPLPSYQDSAPPPAPAPQAYPQQTMPKPQAPLSYPQQTTGVAPPAGAISQSPLPDDQGMKFRPLDKPGYSSDLGN